MRTNKHPNKKLNLSIKDYDATMRLRIDKQHQIINKIKVIRFTEGLSKHKKRFVESDDRLRRKWQ